jgi:hypothetical protein
MWQDKLADSDHGGVDDPSESFIPRDSGAALLFEGKIIRVGSTLGAAAIRFHCNNNRPLQKVHGLK